MDRNAEQWVDAMAEDVALVKLHIDSAMRHDDTDRVTRLAAARKEARRLERDIERFAEDVYGIASEELDAIRL